MPKIEIEVSDEVYRIAKIHSAITKKPLSQAILEVVTVLDNEKAPAAVPDKTTTKVVKRRARRSISKFNADLDRMIELIREKIKANGEVSWPEARKLTAKKFNFTNNMVDHMIATLRKRNIFIIKHDVHTRTNYFTEKK